MTREEAIKTLKGEAWPFGSKEYREAFNMAMEALEQEPCEELFDDWHEAPSYAMTLEQAREAVHELRKENVKLRKEPCEDAVSRQTVLKKVPVLWNSNGDKDYCMESLRDFVVELPPVTPTRKKGKWIEIKNKNGTVIALRCDCCKESPKHAIKSLYCPNCGADMRGGKE